jgi:hypothetical protein
MTAILENDPAYDTPAAAAYLDVAPTTLEIWRCTGRYDLPFEKIGRSVRYRKSALDRWRAARTHVSTAPA